MKVARLFPLILFAACKPVPLPPAVTVYVKVVDEAKEPVSNAELASQSRLIATTNSDGRAEITVTGREGQAFLVDVRCPQGYRSPDVPLEIRRLENGSGAPPEYVTRCNRLRHRLVVNVKTINAPGGLPIRYLGKPLTKTDALGKARVVLEGDVMERVDLTLDTSDPSLSKLHPQSPVVSLEIPNRDEETNTEVKFTVDKPPPKKAVGRPKITQM